MMVFIYCFTHIESPCSVMLSVKHLGHKPTNNWQIFLFFQSILLFEIMLFFIIKTCKLVQKHIQQPIQISIYVICLFVAKIISFAQYISVKGLSIGLNLYAKTIIISCIFDTLRSSQCTLKSQPNLKFYQPIRLILVTHERKVKIVFF